MQKKQGFTLIELLVVIAIIGILSAIGLTALSGAQSKARDVKRKADLGSLNSSLVLYLDAATASTFPVQDKAAAAGVSEGPLDLVAAVASATTYNIETASALAAGGFAIPKAPQATNTQNHYWYITDAAGSMFALFTKLENPITGQTNSWFVSNSKGFSDVPAASSGNVVPDNTNTECVASGGSLTYRPCSAQPIM